MFSNQSDEDRSPPSRIDPQTELVVRLLAEVAQPIAERFLESVDRDTEMRREVCMANLELAREENRRRHEVRVRGQRYALIVVLAGFGLSAYAFYLGNPTGAAIVGGTALAAIVATMLRSSWHRNDAEYKDVEEE